MPKAEAPSSAPASEAGDILSLRHWQVGRSRPDFAADATPQLQLDGKIVNLPALASRLGLTGDGSDAATLCALVRNQGLQGLGRLRGEFAFLLWTGERLILARDAAGRRPLFMRRDEEGLAIASMPAALAANRRVDPIWAARQLLLLPDIERRSGFAGVERLFPGEVLSFARPDAPPETWRWTPRFDAPLDLSPDEAAARMTLLLDQAIDRIVGSAPRVAMQLSSGLDSAILLSRLGRNADRRIDAYTASPLRHPGWPDAMDDEWDAARHHAAPFAQVSLHRVEGPSSAIADAMELFPTVQQPVMNMCNIGWIPPLPTLAAKDGHAVMIEGLSGNFTVTHGSGGRLSALAAEERWVSFAAEAFARGGRGVRTAWRRNPPAFLKRRHSRGAQGAFLDSGFLRGDGAALHDQCEAERGRGRAPERVDAIDSPRQRYFEFLLHRDDAPFRYGLRQRSGVSLADPFADPDVMDLAFRLTPRAFGAPGSRALGYAMLDPRIDVASVRQGARASQGDHWRIAAERDLPLARDLAHWAADHRDLSHMVDAPAILQALAEWPSDGWNEAAQVDRYRLGLMRTLGLVAFVRWLEEGE